MADNWMLGETAALDDYIPTPPSNIFGDAAQGVKDWWTNQPSWLDRAKAENQKTLEAYGRGGMGEIAKQLATDTTEPQDLYGAFGVGNVRGVGRAYPIAPSGNWYGDANFKDTGGRLTYMTPDEYLAKAKPLKIDEISRENIDNLKQHIQSGGELDPLAIYKSGKEDGRHRAVAAKELGIESVPVLQWGAPGEFAAMDAYHPPFYSAVEQAVQGAKQNAAPGQQWAGFLRNQPGVKPEEVEALKLGALFEQPGSVPKEAVLGEIAANRVNVGEVIKGEKSQSPAATRVNRIDQELHDIQNEFNSLHDIGGMHERRAALATQERDLRHERQNVIANWQDQASDRTKFSQYTLPGGENYREMLLTLPKKPVDIGPAPELITELPKGPNWENSYRVIHYGGDPPERAYGVIPPGQAHARAMAGQHPTPEEATRQALNQINAENAQRYNQALHDANKSGQFTSSHYDEPNILAHVRYNDRVIDGKKTLFVEEVQSDWHQKGKKQGYKEGEPQTIPSFTADQLKIHETEHQYVGTTPDGRQQVVGKGTVGDEDGAREYLTRYMNKMAAERNMSAVQAHQAKVPDAPFKTTWPELAMKRIIREAAEKGYDKVAWTPGSVQAERYDLSKHIDKVMYDGQRIWAWKKGSHGSPAINQRVTPEELANVIGKDAAEKLMQQPEQKMAKFTPGETGKYRTLEGADLKIGGEGMKGFYDEILPATVNRLVKKHGGRVQQSDMTAASAASPERVHSLDITPSLRAAAMKGFPLFTAGGVAATGIMGEMARQDEYR